ncbi:hypothetical protein MPRM_17720 [Mycobacterium parmense]|uniref:IS481 family transposase n=1 Tax=Mycobacterium parmense TaxID=185642 RepID=A0A7I7YUR8_9MYCO|nr:hypothetical protein MPRM_17720 [Mycobacterium parmense]
MTHGNAPLSVEGRRRLVARCADRPIAHVAAEMGISRACASKWVNRFRQFGELGLHDRSSAPTRQPSATTSSVIEVIETLRRVRKWSAARIAFELNARGIVISRRTVSRQLVALGLNRRRFLDPSGDLNRVPQRIIARRPGHMIHVDVKKVGRIPDGGVASARQGQRPGQGRGGGHRGRHAGRLCVFAFRGRRLLAIDLHRGTCR